MDVSAIDSFGAAMTDEVEDAASSLLPNIQRLSVIGDLDSEDEDGKEESVLPVDGSLFHPLGVKPLKRKASLLTKASSKSDMTIVPPGRSNSPGAASVVTTVHCGGEVQKVLAPQTANDAPHSPSPVKFIRPPQPFNYEGSSSSGSPLPLRRPAGGISKNTETGSSSIDLLLDGGNFVDPWPDLWTEYRHKPPKLSEKDWKIVNSCLGPLGMPDYGTIPPSDPENREAYKNIRKLLRDSWLVMTGQISPTECDATNTLLKPFLEKEEQEKKAKFEVLEQKLKLRKKALRIPEPSAKRSSGGDYSRRLSIPGTPVMQSSSAMSSPPPIPGSSPFPSFSSESFANALQFNQGNRRQDRRLHQSARGSNPLQTCLARSPRHLGRRSKETRRIESLDLSRKRMWSSRRQSTLRLYQRFLRLSAARTLMQQPLLRAHQRQPGICSHKRRRSLSPSALAQASVNPAPTLRADSRPCHSQARQAVMVARRRRHSRVRIHL
ncbi:hypothetical protein MPH_06911 [Macrophomina phaseolina MS6]|uniref:Uncharacterized protein n=1 Tax=Macrophomina phaseolina (strain MS6) TaxID=1126212 RepID=K2SGI4_MACPH|nr:hypothetical protein MPH_06911 [Macrophomina phaseolina MS6]